MMHFAEWVAFREALEGYKVGPPVNLEFPNGEFRPPIDTNSGYEFEGPGLICFDFDQTLTDADWEPPKAPGQPSTKRFSAPNANPEMSEKLKIHQQAGNKIHVLTARGVEEDKIRQDKRHTFGVQPVANWDDQGRIQGFDYKIAQDPQWSHLQGLNPKQDVTFMGGVKWAHTDPKGPRIAHLMKLHHLQWAILYDDGPANIQSCKKMQDLGWPIHGILVKPKFRHPEYGPADTTVGMSATGT